MDLLKDTMVAVVVCWSLNRIYNAIRDIDFGSVDK